MIDELKKLRDITEILTGNGYLKDQAEEWEYALNAIPDYVYIINTKFEIRFINDALEKRLNVNKNELYGQKCHKILWSKKSKIDCDNIEGLDNDFGPILKGIYLDSLVGWFDITRSPIYTRSSKLIGFICVLQEVTSAKKMWEDLMQREAMLEAIFSAAPIGLCLIDNKKGVVLSVNDFLIELTEYSKEELIGNSTRILYPSEQEFNRFDRLKNLKNELNEFETKFRTKSCKILDILIRIKQINANDCMILAISNITKRKERERHLKLNEDRLESILKLSKLSTESEEIIVDFALEEAVRLTNSKIGYLHFVDNIRGDVNLNLFKWSSNVLPFCKAKPLAHYPLTEAGCWADCVRSGEPVIHNDYKNLTEAEGKRGLPEEHIEIKRHMSVPVFWNGEVVAVAGVGNKKTPYDKTDLRQLELFISSMWDIIKNKQSSSLLESSNLKFKTIFDAEPNVISIIRLGDGVLVDVNPAFEKYTGYKRTEAIGKSVLDLNLWEDLKLRDEFYKRIYRDGSVKNFKVNFKMKDGVVKVGIVNSSIVSIDNLPHAVSIIRELDDEDINS